MVFLGLEKPVEYGSRLIFDPTMANMVLQALKNYVDAMKDDYLRGREDLKEFNKNFGDFFSPILKDMEWYDLNVTGATRDLINNLYAQGIDPLRSVEGRSLISRWVNNMPVGKINQLKQSAATATEYLKNKASLEAAGKFNEDFENFVTGGMSLDNWDTVNNGMWTRMSPSELKSLKELTESSFNNRTPHELTKEQVLSFDGQTYDPRKKYTGFTYLDLLDISNTVAPGLTGTPWLDYYRDVAKRKVIANGQDITEDNINKQLSSDIADSNIEYMVRPVGDMSDWYQQQTLNLKREANALKRASVKNNNDSSSIGWTRRRLIDSVEQLKQSIGVASSFNEWLKKEGNKKFVFSGDYRNAISEYYKTSQHKPKPGESQTAEELFSFGFGDTKFNRSVGESKDKTSTGTNKTYVSFGDDDLRPTAIAEVKWAGRKLNDRGITSKFAHYLKDRGITGEAVGGVTVNATHIGPAENGRYILELNRKVRITREDLEGFAGEDVDNIKDFVDRLRLKGVGKKDSKDLYEYYDIPTSRRIELNDMDADQLDRYDEKRVYGSTTWKKQEEMFETDL